MDNNVRTIIQIQHISNKLWPGLGFWVCVYRDIDPGDNTFGLGHDIPLSKRQQLCELLFRPNVTGAMAQIWILNIYVCTVTLTLCEISSSSNLPMKGYSLETNFVMCEP